REIGGQGGPPKLADRASTGALKNGGSAAARRTSGGAVEEHQPRPPSGPGPVAREPPGLIQYSPRGHPGWTGGHRSPTLAVHSPPPNDVVNAHPRPYYYLENFNVALDWLRSRYRGLLAAEED